MTKRAMVVLEGPDGSGKTTAAEMFKKHDFFLIHTGPPAPGRTAFEQYCRVLDDLRDTPHPAVVFDRYHLGERVYGPVFRAHDTLRASGQQVLEREMLEDFRVVLVICQPPYRVARDTWRIRSKMGAEMLEQEEQFAAVFERYLSITSILPTVRYDFTRESPRWLYREVDRLLTLQKVPS